MRVTFAFQSEHNNDLLLGGRILSTTQTDSIEIYNNNIILIEYFFHLFRTIERDFLCGETHYAMAFRIKVTEALTCLVIKEDLSPFGRYGCERAEKSISALEKCLIVPPRIDTDYDKVCIRNFWKGL